MMMIEIFIVGYVFFRIVVILKFWKESILLFKNYIIYNYILLKESKFCVFLYIVLSLNKYYLIFKELIKCLFLFFEKLCYINYYWFYKWNLVYFF